MPYLKIAFISLKIQKSPTMNGDVSRCVSRGADSHTRIQSTIRGHHILNYQHTLRNVDMPWGSVLRSTNIQVCEFMHRGSIWDPFPTSVRPLCLLIQCRSGWGWPETLQDTDTRSPTNKLCCSVDTNTSGASEMTHHIRTTSPTFTDTSRQTVNTWTDQTRGAVWWHFSQLSCSWRCRHIPRSLTWSQSLWSAGCGPS